MNYRHIYHAGNFADVVKHIILIHIIQELNKKDSTYTILDAFAGIGIYDLSSAESQKTLEYLHGINKLLEYKDKKLPPVIETYLNLIKNLNENTYPGSPTIISSTIRNSDKLIASELHPQDYATLKYNMRKFSNTAVHLLDGYNAMKAFLPPQTTRGLVFLDPAFEKTDEFDKLIEALKFIRKRFFAGITMIWYPIKTKKEVEKFYQDLKTTGYPEFIKIEFGIKELSVGMRKCGVLISNPPHIINSLNDSLKFLSDEIYKGNAEVLVEQISNL
ncbi:MAG: ComJ [Pseudomonadota bacterium]|jgi:23S rRNA (adenine2030-N6)-methyltransferase